MDVAASEGNMDNILASRSCFDVLKLSHLIS